MMKNSKSIVRIPLFPFISIFFFILFWNPASGMAIPIESFEEPFYTVLDNLMTNYWPVEDNGDWLWDEWNDPANCGGDDGSQYSTELLYPLFFDTGDPIYEYRANRTVEFVIGMARLRVLLLKILGGEDITEEGANLPGLLYGQRYYSGSSDYPFDSETPIICAFAGEIMKQGVSFEYLNAYSGPATVAYYDLILSYSFRDQGDSSKAARLARRAYALLEIAEDYWVQESEDVGYYDDPSENDTLWSRAMTLHALATAYQASGKDFYLDRARDMMNYLEDYWDDSPPYGYWENEYYNSKKLSENHLMAKALLILYDATADPAWLDRAYLGLSFMTDPILLIEDDRFPGYSIVSHDWDSFHGANSCSCSGCNFAVLVAIYMYNLLEQQGPSGVDVLPTCMITSVSSAFAGQMREEIEILRTFRDRFLMRSRTGRALVDLYYHYSPPVADWIARHRDFQSFLRILLVPLAAIARWMV